MAAGMTVRYTTVWQTHKHWNIQGGWRSLDKHRCPSLGWGSTSKNSGGNNKGRKFKLGQYPKGNLTKEIKQETESPMRAGTTWQQNYIISQPSAVCMDSRWKCTVDHSTVEGCVVTPEFTQVSLLVREISHRMNATDILEIFMAKKKNQGRPVFGESRSWMERY